MKKVYLKLLFTGIFFCITIEGISQIKYIYLTISQPNVEKCITNIENSFNSCDFNVFPNPSYGLFTLEIGETNTEIQIDLSICDISGNEVIKEEIRINNRLKKTIDLSRYNSGTYILNIRGEHNAVFKASLIVY